MNYNTPIVAVMFVVVVWNSIQIYSIYSLINRFLKPADKEWEEQKIQIRCLALKHARGDANPDMHKLCNEILVIIGERDGKWS